MRERKTAAAVAAEAAERLQQGEEAGDGRRRSSVDFDRGSSGMRWGSGGGGGGGGGVLDKRKRWSVCGGEKRGDLDLETIWEEVLSSAETSHVRTHLQGDHHAEEEDEDEEEVDDDRDDNDDDDDDDDGEVDEP